MTPRRLRTFIGVLVLIISGGFGIVALLAFFDIVPAVWALNALASICAVSIGALILCLAHYAGHEIFEATEPGRFSPVRLAIGVAIAFALVSFFELFL